MPMLCVVLTHVIAHNVVFAIVFLGTDGIFPPRGMGEGTMPSDAERDRLYFERRERQERALAEQACSPEGRRVHMELARCYADMAQQPQPPMRPQLKLHL
jgi:hypothetical protein